MMIDQAIIAVLVIVYTFAAAGLTMLYHFALGDPAVHEKPKGGRALSWLGKRLDAGAQEYEMITRELRASKERIATTPKQLKRARAFDRANPYKVAGVCPDCLNPWVTCAMVGAFLWSVSAPWWWLLLALGLGMPVLNLWKRLLW